METWVSTLPFLCVDGFSRYGKNCAHQVIYSLTYQIESTLLEGLGNNMTIIDQMFIQEYITGYFLILKYYFSIRKMFSIL